MSTAKRRLFLVLPAALALTLALVVSPVTTASAKVPQAPHRYGVKIEPLARYVGQSTCSPAAKQGTQAFANLLLRTYTFSRSLGISRACNVGGSSEHKEGRAFDWGVSANSARDRQAVDDLMGWLLGTDRHGNRHAMARRLGIQYIIWNRRIWGSYAASSGWRRYTGSNPHTDHVHFSLSWAGARKRTSFWNPTSFPNGSGNPPAPSQPAAAHDPEPRTAPAGYAIPQPDPDSLRRPRPGLPEPKAPARLAAAPALLHEELSVRVDRRAGTRPVGALVRGHDYLIEVSGTYRYAKGRRAVADAECSRAPGSGWQRQRSIRLDQWRSDQLDLYIDGHDLYGRADDGGQDCDLDTHTYRWVYRAQRNGAPPLAVWDPTSYRDNSGRLTVRITDLDTTRDQMSWRVPATAQAGVTSPGTLQGGRDYVVTVSGTWSDGRGVTADAECTRSAYDTTWRRSRSSSWGRSSDSHNVLMGRFGYDTITPRLEDLSGEPVTDTGDRCDGEDNTYTFLWRSYRDAPLHVRVHDPDGYRDNTGALLVQVRPYVSGDGGGTSGGGTPTLPPGGEPTTFVTETVQLDSRSSTGVSTRQSFPEGARLRLTVSGVYLMRSSSTDWVAADAECTMTRSDQRWRATRFDGWWDGSWSPLGDVAVAGRLATWRPSDAWGDCDEDQHVYRMDLTTDRSGPLTFVVADTEYGDNDGTLTITVEPR